MNLPELKKFNSEQFSNDVYAHRSALKLSRLAYAQHLGMENYHPVATIETNKNCIPTNLPLVFNLCLWMGKDLSEYFV